MKISAAIFSCALVLVTPLYARDKTDVLIMNNGDRVTCEIKGLDASVLYVSVDYIDGTASVDWSKVRHLESKQLFIVKTQNGSVYTGTLSTADTGGDRPVRIGIAEAAEKNVVIERQRIVNINQTSDRFLQRFNGSINSGLIYSKGNESTQYTLGTQVSYPRERWSAGASFDSTLAGSTGVSTSTRNNASLDVRHLLDRNNWFYIGIGNWLQSSEQDIQLQSNIGGGIGRYIKNSNHATIAVAGGLAWQSTEYSPSAEIQGAQQIVLGMAAADLEFFKFDKSKLAVKANVFPALSNPGRVYTNTNMSYYLKFFGNFTWNLSFYGNWDNQPPKHSAGSNYGASSGLGWTFGNK
ncbi:DUF481 domain-containing protein [Edaphobacter sp. HDX4]|uniref:DUF481 domain-containing protein n=1 Tax=Edaphobacter sp. HDX4 TaxID=2794064 RepID=UPI002FE6AB45